MTKPMTRSHNADTGEITDREMSDTEFTEYTKHNDFLATMQANQETAKKEAELKLSALGLTINELKTLLN